MVKVPESKLINSNRASIYLGTIFISSFFIVYISIILHRVFNITIPSDSFLIFHIFSELISVFIAVSIFVVLFFTFDIFKKKHHLILANTFFIVGVLDTFHTLTYDGMYNMFGTDVQTPTYFWMFARAIFGLGILWSFCTPKGKLTGFRKDLSLIISIIIASFFIFLSISYTHILPVLLVKGVGLTSIKISMEYAIIVSYILAGVCYVKRINGNYSSSNIALLSGVILAIFSEICFTLYTNVYDTLNMTGHILKIASYGYIFWAIFVKNVRRPYIQLFEENDYLTVNVNDLQIAVEKNTKEIMAKNKTLSTYTQKMEEELAAARDIQIAMLPNGEENIHDLRFSSEFIPCDELSGDFLNYFAIDDKNVGFYVMDVAGHGVSAAMLGVFAAKSIGESTRIKQKESSLFSPSSVLHHFYDVFNKSHFPDETHMVMLYGIYNKDSGKITLSSAGLNCAPIVIPNGQKPYFVEMDSGFPICKLGSLFEPEFQDFEIELKFGDKIFFYTDGVSELKNKDGEFLGSDRLIEFIKESGPMPGPILKKKIDRVLENHLYGTVQADDITYCVMEKLSP